MIDAASWIVDGKLRVRVKPGASETVIVGYDDARKALVVAVGAPAQDDKANVELLKFLKRQLGRPVRLSSGASSRDKTVELLD